jgi:hypothetical protein
MRSLMERMKGKMTPYEGMINEERMINEALSSDRELITSNNFFDFKSAMRQGGFATIGYVTGANLEYPTVKLKKDGDKRIKNYPDMDSVGKKLNYKGENIGGIIKLTRYHINWDTEENLNKKYSQYKKDYNNICDEFNCPDGKISDGGVYKTDKIEYGNDKTSTYAGDNEEKIGNTYVNQNTHGATISSKYYLIDISGAIVREVDKEELKDYFKSKNTSSKAVNALRKMNVEEEKIQEFINKTNNLKMKYQRFEVSSILYCVGAYKNDEGKLQKAIFINDNLKDTMKDVKFNPWELRQLEEENRNIDMEDVIKSVNL